MRNIKDIVIGIFAVIGFTAIVTGFTTNNTNSGEHTVPESHVWEVIIGNSTPTSEGRAYMWNKVTGEIRKMSKSYTGKKELGLSPKDFHSTYFKMSGAE